MPHRVRNPDSVLVRNTDRSCCVPVWITDSTLPLCCQYSRQPSVRIPFIVPTHTVVHTRHTCTQAQSRTRTALPQQRIVHANTSSGRLWEGNRRAARSQQALEHNRKRQEDNTVWGSSPCSSRCTAAQSAQEIASGRTKARRRPGTLLPTGLGTTWHLKPPEAHIGTRPGSTHRQDSDNSTLCARDGGDGIGKGEPDTHQTTLEQPHPNADSNLRHEVMRFLACHTPRQRLLGNRNAMVLTGDAPTVWKAKNQHSRKRRSRAYSRGELWGSVSGFREDGYPESEC